MTDNRWFVRSILTIGLVLLGLIPAVANAQQATTVSGQVKTSVGGTPLYGAIVSVPSLRVNAATDAQGRYQLVIPAGTSGPVTLTARLIGFKTQSVQITPAGGSVQQDIALDQPIRLGAHRRPRRELDPGPEPAADHRRRHPHRQLGRLEQRLRQRLARRL